MRGKFRRPGRPGSGIGVLLFFAGLILGVLLVQGRGEEEYAGIFSEYFLNQYASLRLNYEKLLCRVGGCRLGQYATLVCCGAVSAASLLCGALLFGLGLVWGSVLSISTIRLGFRGVLICAAGVLPQIFFYIPAFGWVCLWLRLGGRNRRKYALLAAAGLLFLVFGILTEVYVNPLILKQLLRRM